jgi:hypothetical protein
VGRDLARLNAFMFEPGVLHGYGTTSGSPVIQSGVILTFPAGALLVYDSAEIAANDACMVKVMEDSSFSITASVGSRFIVCRFTWANQLNLAASYVAVTTLQPYDVVLCSLEWSGSTLVNVDSTAANKSSIAKMSLVYDNLRVLSDPTTARQAQVLPGRTYIAGKLVVYGGGAMAIPDASTSTRYDFLGLNINGVLVRIAGVEGAAAPTMMPVGFFPLATVRARVGAAQLRDSDIVDVRPFTAGTERLPTHIFIADSVTSYAINTTVPGDQTITIEQLAPGNAAPTIIFPTLTTTGNVLTGAFAPTTVTIFNESDQTVPLTGMGSGTSAPLVPPGSSIEVGIARSTTGSYLWRIIREAAPNPIAYIDMKRDARAQAQVAAPDARSDIATREFVESRVQLKTGILIPLYIYPANIYTNPDYNNLIALVKTYHDVPVSVILNPSSGPGDATDGNYTVAIKRLQGAGIRVLGYIHCNYGAIAIETVKASIDAWLSLYPGIDSFFLDEMSNDTAYIAYTKAIRDYAGLSGRVDIIGNPGTVSISHGAFLDARAIDRIVYAEGGTVPLESDLKGDMDGGYMNYNPDTRAILIYGQSSLPLATVRMLQQYCGLLYVTERGFSTAWNFVSGYLGQMLAQLSAPQATFTADANAVPIRNAAGQMRVADPTSGLDAVNKTYADSITAFFTNLGKGGVVIPITDANLAPMGSDAVCTAATNAQGIAAHFPDSGGSAVWWNISTYGQPTRVTQIAQQAFMGQGDEACLWIRRRHRDDGNMALGWEAWTRMATMYDVAVEASARDAAVAVEASARDAAVAVEASARAAAVAAEANARAAAVVAEANARAAAVVAEANARAAAVVAEASARANTDSYLDNRINERAPMPHGNYNNNDVGTWGSAVTDSYGMVNIPSGAIWACILQNSSSELLASVAPGGQNISTGIFSRRVGLIWRII